MKKIFTLLLLLCFSILTISFGSKAYYDSNSSYMYIYLDGELSIRTHYDTIEKYVNNPDPGDIASNGWPTAWIYNSKVSNKTFDCVTLDLGGTEIVHTFSELYELWIEAWTFADAEGPRTLNVYLWFISSGEESRFAKLYFYKDDVLHPTNDLNYGLYNTNEDFVRWNTDYSFTYNDLLELIEGSELTDGGAFYFEKTTLIKSDFSEKLVGNNTYRIDYVTEKFTENDYFDESYFDTLVLPHDFPATSSSIDLPNTCCGFDITWHISGTYSDYVELKEYSTYTALKKLKNPTKKELVLLVGLVTAENSDGDLQDFEYYHYISLHSDKQQLDTPVVNISSNKMVWDSVDYCYLYGIYLDDELIATTPNNYYYLPGAIDEVGTYVLTVKALSTNESYVDSNYSNGVTFYYTFDYTQLNTPVLELNGHVISWDAISNAAFYEIYVDLNLVKTVNSSVLSFDLNDLNLNSGNYEIRIKAIASELDQYSDSMFSAEIKYEQLGKTISFYFGNELVKTITYSSLASAYETDAERADYFERLLPERVIKNDVIGIVNAFYLDLDLTDEITSDVIYWSWKTLNFIHLDIYLDVTFPLDYQGPTLIYKNPNSFLDISTITNIINGYCKIGASDKYILSIISDGYTGNGNNPGEYIINYQVKVKDYITDINLTIRVTNIIKADYLYGDTWYTSSIISKEDLISTCKNIGVLPNTELAYSIVSYNEETKTDFYAEKADFGNYSFLINYNSTSGQKGLYQFKIKYFGETPYDFIEESTFDMGFLVAIIFIALIVLAIIFYNTKIKKVIKKTKNKKYSYSNKKNNYYNNNYRYSKKKGSRW